MKLLLAILVVACSACGAIAPGPVAGSPSPTSQLSSSQLKFKVMDAVGKPAYCDPDFYPVARAEGEQANAIAQYAAIKSDTATYDAIVAHENLPSGDLTDGEKLTLYQAWKLLQAVVLTRAGSGFSFQYRVASEATPTGYLMVTGTVDGDGAVNVSARTGTGRPVCPICLAASTLIATPSGDVRVTDVQPGMVVWTQTAAGVRVAATVIVVGSMEAPPGHRMVHLVLGDGRELLVSLGHRTADGRQAGALHVGDQLDGSTIALWELVPYTGGRTYDLLPAGATGRYWADGILMSSTLSTQT